MQRLPGGGLRRGVGFFLITPFECTEKTIAAGCQGDHQRQTQQADDQRAATGYLTKTGHFRLAVFDPYHRGAVTQHQLWRCRHLHHNVITLLNCPGRERLLPSVNHPENRRQGFDGGKTDISKTTIIPGKIRCDGGRTGGDPFGVAPVAWRAGLSECCRYLLLLLSFTLLRLTLGAGGGGLLANLGRIVVTDNERLRGGIVVQHVQIQAVITL